MSTQTSASGKVTNFLHKLFGTTPGLGLQPKEAIAYSITGFGQNLICTIIGSYLTIFMTDALGYNLDVNLGKISGVLAVAFLMLAVRLFDAFNDPIMGSVVDYTRTKWGKCRPYLKWMAIPIGVITILCFLPVYPRNVGGFVAISLVYVVWSVAYTVADVPYWALSSAMESDTDKRGKMLTVARLACTGASGLVTILVPFITKAVTKKYMSADGLILAEQAAQVRQTLSWTYFIVAAVLVILAMPMFFYGFKHTKERNQTTEKPVPLKENIKLLFSNKPLMLIVLSGVLGAARMVYMYTGGLYFCKYALKDESLYGLVTMLVVPGGVVASVLVPWFTKKFSKKWTFIISHLVGAVAMLIMYLVGWQSTAGLVVAIIAMIILGIPQGFSNIMTYALIADSIDYLEWKTGKRAEGICFAMQTLINKIGMAVGAFIGVVAFTMAKISSDDPIGSMTDEGLKKLWDMLVLSGVVSMFACTIPMFFYHFTEDRQRQAVTEVVARKVNNDPNFIAEYAGDIDLLAPYLNEGILEQATEIRNAHLASEALKETENVVVVGDDNVDNE